MPIIELDSKLKLPALQIRELTAKGRLGWISDREVIRVLSPFRINFIGAGAVVFVCQIPGSPDKVAAIHFADKEVTPAQQKSYFYLQRALEVLFPHNFPHFYAASGLASDFSDCLPVSIRAKIAGEPTMYFKKLDKLGRFPFGPIPGIVKKIGLPIQFDSCGNNFILGPDGGVYYVDTPVFISTTGRRRAIQDIKLEKIISYMNTHGHSADQIKTTVASILRLKALNTL